MKKVLLFICVLASLTSWSQAPNKINYQAVARTTSGVALANAPVTLTFNISNSGSYTESVTVTSNNVGIVTHAIGTGTIISGSFSGLNWGAGPSFLSVTIDVGAGPVSMGTQELVSVPYALYAATSGSGSSSTYSPSANVTISSANVLDLSLTGVAAGSYGSNAGPNSSIPTFSVDANGRLKTAGQYSANLNGDVSGLLSNQKVIGINGVPLAATSPTAGQILAYNGTNWTPFTPSISASALWQAGSGTIFENTLTDVVGIGTATPTNKLDIVTSGTFSGNDEQIVSLGSGNALNILKFASSGGGILVSMGASNSSTAVAIGHPGAGYGLTVDVAGNDAILATSTGNVATILTQNKTGPGPSLKAFKTSAAVDGPVVVFDQSATTFTSEVLQVTTSSSAPAIRAVGNAATAGTKPVALQVENGHIRAIGPAPTVANASGGGITVSASSVLGGSSDVAGILSLTASSVGLATTATMDVTLNFNRNYVNPPRVVVTPTSNLQQFAYYISATSVSSFTLRMYIPTGASTNNFGPLTFQFNYMVIE